MTTPTPAPDFVILHPDGRAEYGHRTAAGSLYFTMLGHIPDVSSSGIGEHRVFHSDTFTSEMPHNHFADHVIGGLGYHHRHGWHGLVAVSMEEDRGTGDIPPLTDLALARITVAVIGAPAALASVDRSACPPDKPSLDEFLADARVLFRGLP